MGRQGFPSRPGTSNIRSTGQIKLPRPSMWSSKEFRIIWNLAMHFSPVLVEFIRLGSLIFRHFLACQIRSMQWMSCVYSKVPIGPRQPNQPAWRHTMLYVSSGPKWVWHPWSRALWLYVSCTVYSQKIWLKEFNYIDHQNRAAYEKYWYCELFFDAVCLRKLLNVQIAKQIILYLLKQYTLMSLRAITFLHGENIRVEISLQCSIATWEVSEFSVGPSSCPDPELIKFLGLLKSTCS